MLTVTDAKTVTVARHRRCKTIAVAETVTVAVTDSTEIVVIAVTEAETVEVARPSPLRMLSMP